MSKQYIHFHSDCSFFGGCENMLANLLNSDFFHETYRVSFSYRKSLRYENGYAKRVHKNIEIYALKLIDFYEVNRVNILKPFAVIFLKPIVHVYNFLVLYKLFRNKNIDILHINNGGYPGAYSCMPAVFAAKFAGIKKIVYVVNNIAFPYKSLGRLTDYIFDKFVANNVDMFITGSNYAKSQLSSVLNLTPRNVRSIPNGIERRSFLIQPKTERCLFGIVALMEKRKGHIYLLKAFNLFLSKLKDENLLPFLLIEGHGKERALLVDYVKKNGLENFITFVGDENNIFDFIANVDVLVLPSIGFEDFPNVILEAMSLSKPVIATNIAGIPEQIDNMKTGIIVEPKNIEALCDAMLAFYNDKNQIVEMGDNAKIRFEKFFTKEIAIGNYMKMYLELL